VISSRARRGLSPGLHVRRDTLEIRVPHERSGDVVVRAAFGIGPVRCEHVIGAPIQQEVERLAEQLADLRGEHWIDIAERGDPAAEL
jgi:hypothetical protein